MCSTQHGYLYTPPFSNLLNKVRISSTQVPASIDQSFGENGIFFFRSRVLRLRICFGGELVSSSIVGRLSCPCRLRGCLSCTTSVSLFSSSSSNNTRRGTAFNGGRVVIGVGAAAFCGGEASGVSGLGGVFLHVGISTTLGFAVLGESCTFCSY